MSGRNHWERGQDESSEDYQHSSTSYSYIMGGSYELPYAINKFGYENVTSNTLKKTIKISVKDRKSNGKKSIDATVTYNQDYKSALQNRFGLEDANPKLGYFSNE